MDGEISPAEVEELLDAGADVRIVDIRSREEFERGHVPGSENVPLADLPNEIERFDGARHVVTVCPHGQASVQAARLVASYEGVPDDARVESMAGGLTAWESELETGGERTADEQVENGGPDEELADGPDAPF